VTWIPGYAAPGTPSKLDRVGVVKVGPSDARNVLVLEPGTSAGAAYFVPLAKTLVWRLKGWQVWSVERRENQLEDQSVLDQVKAGKATAQQLFDYYLGFVTNQSISPHFQFVPDASVAFAKQWGMRTTVEDLRRVIAAARKGGRRVVLGGHSLGGSIVTAYATWDFNGRAGAKDLSGLVYAFAAALGSTRVLDAARALARQSHLPRRDVTLVDRHATYAHNDSVGAFPRNDFLSRLVAFLSKID
jgi:pimeloyl-ACP methyl ester carboxylesterase